MKNEFYQWHDATNYRRDQTDKTPNAWEYTTPDLQIWISTGHIYNPGKWVVTCYALGFDALPMDVDPMSIDIAQATALRIVKSRLQRMLSNLEPKPAN